MSNEDIVLEVRNLKTNFYTYEGVVKALDGINLKVRRGETVGLVGETGCGKSVTARSIMRLILPPGRIEEGEILLEGRDLLKLSDEEMRKIRGSKIAIVFQDPMTYTNPVFTIGYQIAEVIKLHQDLTDRVHEMRIRKLKEALQQHDLSPEKKKKLEAKLKEYEALRNNPPKPTKKELDEAAREEAIKMLKLVRMPYPEKVVDQYPHELSGGMRQRAMIAMALSCNPILFIADEATTALDVTIQAQVLELINELKSKFNSSVIIITHDLGVVANTCDTVAVMYAGVIVERGSVERVFNNPTHPYTQGLLAAIPRLNVKLDRLATIKGSVPNLIYPPPGCRFHPRCDYATEECKKEKPPVQEIEPEHYVACYHPIVNGGN